MKPLKIGDRVIGAGNVTLRVEAMYKPAKGRVEMVDLVGDMSGAPVPPMPRAKVEAMERAR